LAGEDGDIIAGHGRLAAARLLGFTEVPERAERAAAAATDAR